MSVPHQWRCHVVSIFFRLLFLADMRAWGVRRSNEQLFTTVVVLLLGWLDIHSFDLYDTLLLTTELLPVLPSSKPPTRLPVKVLPEITNESPDPASISIPYLDLDHHSVMTCECTTFTTQKHRVSADSYALCVRQLLPRKYVADVITLEVQAK